MLNNLLDKIYQLNLEDKIEIYRHLEKNIEKSFGANKSLGDIGTPQFIANRIQSLVYMNNLLKVLWEEFKKFPFGSEFTLLDVGPGTGSGANLLAYIHSNLISSYLATVDVLDIDDSYKDYFSFKNQYIKNFYCQDLFSFDKKYDFVICSHCIEHVNDPYNFVLKLQSLAKIKIIVTAPWKENPACLTRGHVNILDEEFIKLFPEKEFFTEESVGWGIAKKPRYKQFFLILNGTADITCKFEDNISEIYD